MRGKHSTGVARVWRDGYGDKKTYRSEIRKDTVNAYEFYEREEQRPVLNEVTPVAIMGHNRWATVGDKADIAGAHPFENERFIGFHNGTLKDKKYTDDRKFLTDSESLYDDLANSDDPKKLMEELDEDSAFALAYFDKHTKRIGFVRNKHRTLHFATNQDRSVVYYSSEAEMLYFALDRIGINYEDYHLDPWRLIETTPDDLSYLYRGEGKDRTRVNTWWITKFEPNPPKKPVIVHYHNGTRVTQPRPGWRCVFEPLKCKMCEKEVEYANGANGLDRKNNPIYNNSLKGLLCVECDALVAEAIEEDKKNKVPPQVNHPLVLVN